MRGKNSDLNDWERFSHPLGFIRLILLVDWDPIGVFGHPKAMDEYDSYAIEVYDLLVSDASQEELVTCLRQIEREYMESGGNPNMDILTIAAKLRVTYDTARADED